MTEAVLFAGLFGIGAALGLFYYGGLWVTVNRLSGTGWPGLLTLASFLLRTAVMALGFLWLMQGSALRLVVMLLGFITVRLVLVRYLSGDDTLGWKSVLKGDFSS